MIKIKIGEEERLLDLHDVDEQWINQQINRRRADGQSVCVRLIVQEHDLDMVLSTANCETSGGSRPPRPDERKVFELWDERGLNDADFTGGNLVAFLKQFKHLL